MAKVFYIFRDSTEAGRSVMRPGLYLQEGLVIARHDDVTDQVDWVAGHVVVKDTTFSGTAYTAKWRLLEGTTNVTKPYNGNKEGDTVWSGTTSTKQNWLVISAHEDGTATNHAHANLGASYNVGDDPADYKSFLALHNLLNATQDDFSTAIAARAANPVARATFNALTINLQEYY